jgi:hypothetical protein
MRIDIPSISVGIRRSQWTRRFAVHFVRACEGRQQVADAKRMADQRTQPLQR